MNKYSLQSLVLLLGLLNFGCATPARPLTPNAHLRPDSLTPTTPPVEIPPLIPIPLSTYGLRSQANENRISLTVNNQNIQELLLALANDAQLNIDIHPAVSGHITLHAFKQTPAQILERIARQLDLRFEFDGPNLSILPDTPYLVHYRADYPNLLRNSSTSVSTSSQISQAGGTNLPPTGAGGGSANISASRIENTMRSAFWESLEKNIKDILRESDKVFPEGSSETQIEHNSNQQATGPVPTSLPTQRRARSPIASPGANNHTASSSQSSGNTIVRRNTYREAASVIVNHETGVLAVRATQRQHDKVSEFITRVLQTARRQVLIEATIVEVTLNDSYEQGIDWSHLTGSGLLEYIGNPLRTSVNAKLTRNGELSTLISFLAGFGSTRVLSSPRLSVLNNQSAILKVVENYVYFTVKADAISTANVGTTTTYTTTPQTVPIGLVLAITPQIGEDDQVILNIRPSITSIGREIPDPNPDLRKNGIENLVPVIRTREIESIMRITHGQTAVLGGLMEDSDDERRKSIPGIAEIPWAGEIFRNRSQQRRKTELVVFLKPMIIQQASLDNDYAHLRPWLPTQAAPGKNSQ